MDGYFGYNQIKMDHMDTPKNNSCSTMLLLQCHAFQTNEHELHLPDINGYNVHKTDREKLGGLN